MSQQKTIFQKISLAFFRRPKRTALIWVALLIFGIASYTTLLKREGFPAIETPIAIAQGAYLVNDSAKVDADVAKPLSRYLLKQEGVKDIQTQSFANLYVAQVTYKDGVDAEARSKELQQSLRQENVLPAQAQVTLEAFKFGFTDRGDDVAISFYNKDPASNDINQLVTKAQTASEFIRDQNLSLVQSVSILNPFQEATNPQTGEKAKTQKTFDRYGASDGTFYQSVIIGIQSVPGADELELDKQVQQALNKLTTEQKFADYQAVISGSNAPNITMQISELQKTLLEGLVAVLIVGSIIIAVRASLITVISMVTVIAIVNGLLYAAGYSLNTITLFGLILGLSLIVDDTIIMIEAIDAQRRRRDDPTEVVDVATRKVGRAMMAATSTAALSFAPLLFVGGILGSFIRAIPITIISALAISLLVALIFIPLFARFILLRKGQLGKKQHEDASVQIEAKIAKFLSGPMLWAQHSRKKLFGVGIVAVFIGLSFIMAGGFIFQKVKFSIFPTDKDSNQLSVVLNYEPGTGINKAESITDNIDEVIAKTLGDNFIKASYFATASAQSATLNIDITDYKDREVKAPELVDQLNAELKKLDGVQAKASQLGAGPPSSQFAARVKSDSNRDGALELSNDIAAFLENTELKRADGSVAKIDSVASPDPSIYYTDGLNNYVQTKAEFVDDDTSALVTIAQTAVEKEFPPERVASYGLDKNSLSFDFGQESENQDSFKTLAIAFPLLLVVIYLLLALQFKSLLQPLLIFTAIPFSIFGITLGLYLTDNPFSFFAALGFFALIGLSIKNTILLTDYANQSRRAGLNAVDAAHEALAERFRPLIATSLTAIVSLIPLALTSPFWEGLAFVLIFGLLSSTFLVVTVFPYYYLGAEYLRTHINRRTGLLSIVVTGLLIAGFIALSIPALIPVAPIAVAIALFAYKRTLHS